MSDRLAWLALLHAVLMLAGCAGGAPKGIGAVPENASVVEQPVSTQTPATDNRQRAKAHTELGQKYLQLERFEVALEEARIALDADSGYAPAYNLLGQTYMVLGQNDQAESNFRKALQLAPADPEINNDYGWFLCQTNKVKESFAYFNLALRNPLYQTPAKALTGAGICSMRDGDDTSGESYLFQALKIDPNNLRAYYLLADIGYRNRRYDDARDWLKQLHAKMEPTAETAWLALRIERKLGDREGEARFTGVLRRKFRDAPEYQLLQRGEFD